MPTSDNQAITRNSTLAGRNPVLAADVSDAQLLENFIALHDEVSFRQLLARHGPMVMGVCLRVLGDEHVAEDAFQATFLVLAKKAQVIHPRSALGNWLYGVAYRTARRCRASMARLRAREKQMATLPEKPSEGDELPPEVVAIVDEELNRLPEKYRLPMVLCELEGRPRQVVAQHLKMPEGTLSSRLAAGRKMLAQRLTRRGFRCTVPALSAFLAQATVKVPPPLASAVTVAALAVSPQKPMRWGWLAAAAIGLFLVSGVAYVASSVVQPSHQVFGQFASIEELQGSWICESSEMIGDEKFDRNRGEGLTLRISGDQYETGYGNGGIRGNIRSFHHHANWFNFETEINGQRHVSRGIFEIRDGKLHLAIGQERPTDFDLGPQCVGVQVQVFRRANIPAN